MKIQLTTGRAGQGFEQFAGQVISLPHAEAVALLRSGQAEPVVEDECEAAIKAAPRNASLPAATGKK